MGVEQGGPSEEDLKTRPGEPEGREQNKDNAQILAEGVEKKRNDLETALKEKKERIETIKDQLDREERDVVDLERQLEDLRNYFTK
jgi:chromosome segregation ATPase